MAEQKLKQSFIEVQVDLHIVDNDGKTESYDIYDGGVYVAKVAKQM